MKELRKIRAPLKTQWKGSLKEGVAKNNMQLIEKPLPSAKK
jgi:hypothetical protein